MKNKLLLIQLIMFSAIAVLAQSPVISNLSPEYGQIGTTVQIIGNHFSSVAADNIVYFGATRAEVISAVPTQLDVIVPAGATYKPVTVTVNGLTASSAAPFVAIFNSTGTFGNRNDIWAGAQVRWATVGDIDGDNKPDIIAVDELWNQLNIWRNTSVTGILSWDSFAFMQGFTTHSLPYSLEVADLDGDGKLDVVVSHKDAIIVSVFLNTSTPGSISFASPIEFETAQGPLFVSVSDLDDDGKLDIATACANNFGVGAVSVLRNTSTPGTLSFAPHVDFNVGEGGVWCVKLEDIDTDGKTDMLVTSGGSAILSVFKNTSTPGSLTAASFAPRVDFATGEYPAIMATGDFDGDLKVDVVVANAVGNTISLFRNISTPGLVDISSFVREDISSPAPWNPTAGDVNGDGKIDILMRDENGNLLILRNSSTVGSFSFTPQVIENAGAPLGISVADLDGDTKADLMFSAENYNTIVVLQNLLVNPPTALAADFVGNSGFEARWIGEGNAYEYLLDVSTAEDFSVFVPGYQDKYISGPPFNTLRSTVAGLTANKNYYYRVRSTANGNPSVYSETIAVHTSPNPPTMASNIWAKQFGGAGEEEIQSMTSDLLGNIYIAGHYRESMKLGKTTLTSKGDFDIFFACLNPQGNVVWARSIGGIYYDNEVSITVSNQGLFLTAQYAGEIDVDPGPAKTTFMNDGDPYINDGFFARYNLLNGGLVWAKKLADAATWSSSSIDTDGSGIYLAGHFNGSVDFNPGPGVAMLTSHGGEDVFLAKYNLNGGYLWADGMGGYGNDAAWGVLVDDSGVYIHGTYGDVADFNPRSGVFNLNGQGGFFGRYDLSDGKFRYAKSVGNQAIFSMARLANRLFIGGNSFGSIDADPGPGSHYIGVDGLSQGLVGSYDLLDGKFRWAKALPTTAFIGLREIQADITGVYVSGFFAGSVDFDPDAEETNLSSAQIDAFAAHYSILEGSLLWAKGIGGPGRAVSIAATLTVTGYYLGGFFAGTSNFDPYTNSVVMTSVNESNDLFIAKYNRWCFDPRKPFVGSASSRSGEIILNSSEETGNQWFKDGELIQGETGSTLNVRSVGNYSVQCSALGCSGATSDAFSVRAMMSERPDAQSETPTRENKLYPNPAESTLTLDLQAFGDGIVHFTITDTHGKLLLNDSFGTPTGRQVDVSTLSSGIYILQARQGDKVFTERFVKK